MPSNQPLTLLETLFPADVPRPEACRRPLPGGRGRGWRRERGVGRDPHGLEIEPALAMRYRRL